LAARSVVQDAREAIARALESRQLAGPHLAPQVVVVVISRAGDGEEDVNDDDDEGLR